MRISKAMLFLLTAGLATPAPATVFINEVLINPPGSGDALEFIELMGTPGMKLDGYAVMLINGGIQKYYPANTIPPRPEDTNEIDEFFSLDGLRLGANGILVLTRAVPNTNNYFNLLTDANAIQWGTLWNGGLAAPSALSNDGSNTVLLVRRRPGDTQANCPDTGCGNLRWGKAITADDELLQDIPDPPEMDQWGNGNVDDGTGVNPDGGTPVDMKGRSTPADITDDLEVVDEVSIGQDGGWEYEIDERRADLGIVEGPLHERRVHTLGDPAGFNPDGFSRVDYRVKGPGWPPLTGATGQLPNGNNWQDTATEQWIRGDGAQTGGIPPAPIQYYYSIAPNIDPGALQPYATNVPFWLNDGQAPDFDFVNPNTFEIEAGRINPLAVPFIVGDTDRDGDCDVDDIAKCTAVFGNDDWIFSNSFPEAPQGNAGDPTTQTRPWDVDGTGDNGIEPTDLQWVLNFRGSTDGRIVGVAYDSTTPAATGVTLNSNTGVVVTVSAAASSSCGRPLNGLFGGDQVEVTVSAHVSSGAISTAGQENGVMQFVHDLTISAGGVLKVVNVEALGGYNKTRAAIESPQGVDGDLGVNSINGHSTSFVQGLASPAALYKVTLEAIGTGSATVGVGPATLAKFAASTPSGVKLGHTRNASGPIAADIGNPASASYPAAIAMTVVAGGAAADIDDNGQVNSGDVTAFVNVLLDMPGDPRHVTRSDLNCDGLRNGRDIQPFVFAYLGG